MQNIFKIDAVNSIRNIRITTQRLARVMKKDSLKRKRDYNQISELNFRLKRVIPIIPLSLGAAGTIAGGTVSSGLPLIPGFRYFSPGRPPVRPGFRRPGRGPNRGDPPPDPEGSRVTQLDPVPDDGPVVVTGEDPVTENVDERSPEYSRARQEKAKALAEAERERKRLLGEQEGQTGTPALEPALISEKLKEIYGERFPEVFEEGPVEVPTIIPTTKPIETPERELPPPLRLVQGVLDVLKLNEVAKGTTRYTLGQDGSQEKFREILELTTNDEKVANQIVQGFGLSTQLVPLIKLAYNLIPVGPAKYKKLFSTVRFIVNAVRQGKLSTLKGEYEAQIGGYVSSIRTGSADIARQRLINDPMRGVVPKRPFKGISDSQRIQNARAIERQGAMRAQGVDRSSPSQTYQNIFGQTEFSRKIQQALGDRFPKGLEFKPTQGTQNPYDSGNAIVPFDIKNLGTLVRNKQLEVEIPKYFDKVQTRGFFNRNPIPKKGDTKVELKPGDIRSQIERSGGFEDDFGNFYMFGDTRTPVGPQSSADTLIQPIIIIRGTAA